LYLVPVLVCTGDEMSFCFTGRQHLKEDVDRETVNERRHSISDMYNMFEYAKQAYRDSMPYGAMGAFFHDRTLSRSTAATQESSLKGCEETCMSLSEYTITVYDPCTRKERPGPTTGQAVLRTIVLRDVRAVNCRDLCRARRRA